MTQDKNTVKLFTGETTGPYASRQKKLRIGAHKKASFSKVKKRKADKVAKVSRKRNRK